jgi:hypothetical protein
MLVVLLDASELGLQLAVTLGFNFWVMLQLHEPCLVCHAVALPPSPHLSMPLTAVGLLTYCACHLPPCRCCRRASRAQEVISTAQAILLLLVLLVQLLMLYDNYVLHHRLAPPAQQHMC